MLKRMTHMLTKILAEIVGGVLGALSHDFQSERFTEVMMNMDQCYNDVICQPACCKLLLDPVIIRLNLLGGASGN
jgi:hypothetical protein